MEIIERGVAPRHSQALMHKRISWKFAGPSCMKTDAACREKEKKSLLEIGVFKLKQRFLFKH